MASLFKHEYSSMGCPCELQFYAESTVLGRDGIELATSEVRRLDQKYSHYREDSLLSAIQSGATQAGGVVVDDETAALLDYADTQYRVSAGLFDITARSLSALWDRITSIPRQDEIDEALRTSGWDQVTWDGHTLEMPAGLAFDLGGIVKEYAADRVAGMLKQAGIQSGIIDLGGDLHILGPHPDGTPWRAGIRDPDGSGNALATIGIRSGGLASSGDYERFSEIDGKQYGHIINPKTGWPVSASGESLASVSILAPSCLLAGSVSTLAMLAGAKKGLNLLGESGLPWLAVGYDGSIRGTLAHVGAISFAIEGPIFANEFAPTIC
jgi:thiamine biosynthesis lipoprotein